MKPASIRMFDILFLGMILTGLVSLALNWTALMDGASQTMAATGMGENSGTVAKVAIIGGALFGVGVNVALWFLISSLRIEMVKWVLIALTAWTLFGYSRGFAALGGFTLTNILGLVSTLLMVGAIAFLFRPDAKAWFQEKRSRGSE
jgi:hypothetical protein